MTNPELDSDGDGIQNILEAILGTKMDDASSFVPIAIPSQALIDNTQQVEITYDFSRYFPDYPTATAMSAVFPAGSLARSYIPLIITMTNTPATASVFTQSGFDVLGRYIEFGSENGLTGTVPATLQIPKNAPVARSTFSPYHYINGAWEIFAPEHILTSDANAATLRLQNSAPIVFAGEKKSGSKTLYFGGGYVYSDNAQAVARYLVNLSNPALLSKQIDSVRLTMECIDLSAGGAGVPKSVLPIKLARTESADPAKTAYHAYGQVVNNGPMRVASAAVTLHYTDGSSATYTQQGNPDQIINSAQTMMVHIDVPFDRLTDEQMKTQKWFAFYYYPSDVTFESASFGDGRIVYDHSGTAGSELYTYEYYLTDHLGSTRVVLNDKGIASEQLDYQPYGTVRTIGTPTGEIAVREKFTTKEFDEEGGSGNGVDGMRLMYFGARSYDAELGGWLGTDPADELWNAFGYCANDPLNLTDPTGAIIEGLGEFFTSDVNLAWFNKLSEQAPGLAEILWDLPFSVGPSFLLGTGLALNAISMVTTLTEISSVSGIPSGDPIGNYSDRISLPYVSYDRYGLSYQNNANVITDVVEGYARGEAASPGLIDPMAITPGGIAKNVNGLLRGTASKSTTTLSRAVGPAELADIQATNALRNLGYAEGKYFTTSAEAAASYAKQAVKGFGDPAYTLIKTEVPNSVFRGLSPAMVDRGIPAWVIPNQSLPGLAPTILDYMPIPLIR